MPTDPREFEAEGEMFEKVVTVLVGSEKRSFTIHEHLLCRDAPFFFAALKDEWKEGRERVIPLEDDDPKVFALYGQWLYRKRVFSRKPADEAGNNSEELNLLVDAYTFAEKIQDGDFKDAIIDAIIMNTSTPHKDGHYWYPTCSMVDRAYKITPVGSPLRRLMVDFYVFHGYDKWIGDDVNHDFLSDLVKELYSFRRIQGHQDPTRASSSSCSYHHHSEDRQCYSKQLGKLGKD